MKEFLKYTRDALCYLFAWLVICAMLVSLISGKATIEFTTLWKLLAFCAWTAVTFVFCFLTKRMQRRGFVFSLTCFCVLFIPADVLFFYESGILEEIVNFLNVTCVLIDFLVMRKRASDYTKHLEEYKNAR